MAPMAIDKPSGPACNCHNAPRYRSEVAQVSVQSLRRTIFCATNFVFLTLSGLLVRKTCCPRSITRLRKSAICVESDAPSNGGT